MSLVDHSLVIRKHDPDDHQARIERLKAALGSGAHLSTAASYAGVSPSTLSKWIKEGQRLREVLEAVRSDPDDTREPSPQEWELIWLTEELEAAEAKAEHGLVEIVQGAAQEEWKAAAWLLERRFKERWARRSEMTGADGGALQVDDVAVRRQQVMDALEAVKERLDGVEGVDEDGAEVVSIEAERRVQES